MKTRKKRPNKEKKKKRKKSRPLFWSSLIFTTNMVHSFIRGLYLYSFCFASLTITSMIVHTEYNIYTNVLDKCAISSIILYGGYHMWSTMDETLRTSILLSLCVLTFISSIGMYIYQQYTHDRSSIYHVAAHCITSIGHHIILLL